MFLSDFASVINYLIKVLGDKVCMINFSNVAPSMLGDTWIFSVRDSDAYYKVYTLSGVIVKEYSDTWRNPKHREIIYGGKK